ncbi:helix-turn-helix domain-containing protein [Pseudomonas sp. PDM17]|uniref:helix-turn-helix domain-containing protein n=1 Tax=Pseudomonas sp. PDM17 TaxID=2769285 RepID=UPI00177D4D44|nr:helix-turn-helix transcriptional regulator [Pseudomonas sp. PDM17]MBD9499972.1 helix-turn-helix domain-containing protein [Pseudomonas sp. PDM17]
MNARVDLSAWGEQPPQWVCLLAAEVEQTNRTRAGERIGMSRSAVSLVLSNRYPSPSTSAVERRVVAALGALDCPAQGEPISLIECQSYREKKAPTHNPQAMQQWKACQHCTNNPNCAQALEASHASQH